MGIGGALAEARSEAGLTVTQVSERTRIRETIIRGIEHDDYSACGGDYYARGHIRAIARVVGADPVPLIEEYDAARQPPPELPDQSEAPPGRRLSGWHWLGGGDHGDGGVNGHDGVNSNGGVSSNGAASSHATAMIIAGTGPPSASLPATAAARTGPVRQGQIVDSTDHTALDSTRPLDRRRPLD